MRRFHFLQFDDERNGENDVAVKAEPAAAAATASVGLVGPARPPASSKRTRIGSVSSDNQYPAALVAANEEAVCDELPVVEPAAAFGHQCPHCSYRSNIESVVIYHVRAHTGEKPFKVRRLLLIILC